MKIFDDKGNAITLDDVFPNFSRYGTTNDGLIFLIDESKLTVDLIRQIRHYLSHHEIKIRLRK